MLHYTKSCETGQIESGLCGCCSDCSSCCYTIFCYPCADAKAWAGSRGENCNCCHCLIWPSGMWARQNIKHARGMRPGYCCDFLTSLFCPFCFVTQNLREIKLINEESQA